jgi:hypothetical protein
MEAGTKNARWLKALPILLVMVGIFLAEVFVSGEATQQKVIRMTIELAAFAALPIGYRLWFHEGGERISTRRWIVFFLVLIVGLPAVNFLLLPFLGSHPSIRRALAHFASSPAGESLPVLVFALTLIYAILKDRHSH